MAEFKCPSCGHVSRRPALSPGGGEAIRQEAEQIAWDEAARQLALYDDGKPTYGHHAAEAIARAIRSLASPGESSSGSREE